MEGFTESELLEKGLSLFSRGEYKKSEKLLSEVLEMNKLNTKAIFCLANIFHIKGELGKSLKAYKKVLELDKRILELEKIAHPKREFVLCNKCENVMKEYEGTD